MTTATRSCRAQRGFTLLEVMIAIALTALVGIGVASLVNQLVTTRERFDAPAPLAADVDFERLVSRRLEALVVRPIRQQGLLQFNAELDYRPDIERLEWVSRGAVALPLGDFYTRLRRQRLQWHPDTGRLTLSSTGLLDAAGEPQWQQVAALDGVSALHVAFYDGGRWRDVPPPDIPSRGVRLTWERQGHPITLMAVLPEVMP